MIWFLVSIATGSWMGPLPAEKCLAAASLLYGTGIVCKAADTMMVCPAPDHPGAYMSCPHFTFPQVTVKP